MTNTHEEKPCYFEGYTDELATELEARIRQRIGRWRRIKCPLCKGREFKRYVEAEVELAPDDSPVAGPFLKLICENCGKVAHTFDFVALNFEETKRPVIKETDPDHSSQ